MTSFAEVRVDLNTVQDIPLKTSSTSWSSTTHVVITISIIALSGAIIIGILTMVILLHPSSTNTENESIKPIINLPLTFNSTNPNTTMTTTNEIIPEDLIIIASTTTIIEINQLNTTIPLESIFID